MTSQTTNQITNTLQSLLPSYTQTSSSASASNDFPPALVNLTHSLLQRSRARVSSLKAEEEIARCWVVAEIACHRLKTRLNLPKIESRPPCPPKVYKKLYGYLERVLKEEVPERERERRVSTNGDTGIDARGDRSVQITPGMDVKSRMAGNTMGHALPVRSVPVGKRNGSLVGTRAPLEETSSPARSTKRGRFSRVEGREEEKLETGDADDDRSSSESDRERFVDADEFIEDEEEEDITEQPTINGKQLFSRGRGSLMQARYDWLSKERRLDFEQWKAGILRQVDEMERAGKRPRVQKLKGVQ